MASLGLQLPGILSDKLFIIVLGFTVAATNWLAEYFKHNVGSNGMSIIFGLRWRQRYVPTLWLIAAPRK
jgi:hypothetical protein